MLTGFKMLKSHSPTGIEAIVRTSLRILNENAAVVLEVSYQIVGGNQHCVSIVFEAPATRIDSTYDALDGLEEPKESGTLIRRRDGSTSQG
jgi:hypothetical protein